MDDLLNGGSAINQWISNKNSVLEETIDVNSLTCIEDKKVKTLILPRIAQHDLLDLAGPINIQANNSVAKAHTLLEADISESDVPVESDNEADISDARVWCKLIKSTPAPPPFRFLKTPFFAKCMSRNRFDQIKKYLHFVDDETYNPATHPNPKLNKIFPIYERLVERFQNLCVPEKNITIDESLLLYKGRLGWVQYIPLKRSRFGIYLLCESKSGYVYNFVIYTGKGTILDPEYSALPVSSQVVMTLVKPLLNKGYCLTMDNFYNSPQLADLLVSKKTDVYGTLRANRKEVPKELSTTKILKGEVIGFQRGKVAVLKWKDKKEICLLSSIHGVETVNLQKRGETIPKPKLVHEYNNTMGGSDTKTALEYRMDIVKLIMEKYHHSEFCSATGRPSVIPTPMRLTGRHFPEYIPGTEKKNNPTRQCAMCSRVRDGRGKKIRRESSLSHSKRHINKHPAEIPTVENDPTPEILLDEDILPVPKTSTVVVTTKRGN
ncbi:hypothetical protein ILUMI_26671 [Ignelater luminosus]|uniref:PiggyBac transposable element-derived protein domain-containing protein n=1 Tax=Ignelater luminosus TaxID=2038154 RepID=A0A8K0C807_IGNLU|nr:hypothetical protein ILUMI_26671 [Ignelater luminosus]